MSQVFPGQQALDAAVLRGDDRTQPVAGPFHLVIDHHVVVAAHLLQLLLGPLEAAEDNLFRLRSPLLDPPPQFIQGGRDQKDEHPLGKPLFHLSGTLHLDFQQNVFPFGQTLLNQTAGSSVVIPDVLRPLQQLALAPSVQTGTGFENN